MEFLDYVVILVSIGVITFIVNRWIGLADSRARIELSKRLQKTKDRSSGDQRRDIPKRTREPEIQEPDTEPIGSWVPQLLEQFGIDPEVLFEEEMPQELKTFLPIVKGYVNAQGGLPGIAKMVQEKTQEPEQSGPFGQGI